MRTLRRVSWLLLPVLVLLAVDARAEGPRPTPTPTPRPTPIPEPSPELGRVVYRSNKVAGFESLGVTMIACRHRDPVPRRIGVDFYDRLGRPVTHFGAAISPPLPAGKKVTFVTDGTHFQREGFIDVKLGHLSIGTARVVSDAQIVHCIGKMYMDGGPKGPSYRDEIGLVRDGQPFPPLSNGWDVLPPPVRRR